MLLLLDSGVRSLECVRIQLDEVDWQRKRVLVHGKGAKQRWVGFGERTGSALHDYVKRFRGDGAGALFISCRGDGMVEVGLLPLVESAGCPGDPRSRP